MTCAIRLKTFLLICLFQAEHVCCLWATQAQDSQRQSGNAYVGFSRQDRGLSRDGGSNPQNQFRQASVSPRSAQSSSFNPEPAVRSGYDQGFSSSGHTQTVSQPAHSGYASVMVVGSSPVSNPDWKMIDSKLVNAQSVPKTQFLGRSTSIASGSSLRKHSQNKNRLSDRTQQVTRRINQHLSGNSASAQSPTFSARAGYPPSQPSSLFGAGAAVPEHGVVRTPTSSTVRGRRVSSLSKAAASKPSSISVPQNERIGSDPSQPNLFKSQMFTVTGGSAQGEYAPPSSMASSYPQSAFAPRSLGGSQGLNYDPGYSQTWHASSLGNTRNQGKGGLRAPGRSSQDFAPTITYAIPNRFGGSPIRRLKGPSDQKQVVQTPQLKYTAPSQQTASYNPQGQSVHPESKWKSVSRLHQ